MFNNRIKYQFSKYLPVLLILIFLVPGIPSFSPKAEAAAGSPWTSINNGGFSTNIAYGNGLFVIVGIGQSGFPQVRTSNDGVTWTNRTVPGTNVSYQWQSVTFGDGVFVAVGFEEPSAWDRRARIMRSTDGINWTLVTLPASIVSSLGIIADVAYGNRTFAAVGRFGGAIYSSDFGLTWTQTSVPTRQFRGIAYGNGLFVAVGPTGVGSRVLTSPDGINWTARTSIENSWNDVTFGNGQFVAVSWNGSVGVNQVMTSPDGITWTGRNAAAVADWSGIAYGNGLYVAVTGNNTANTTVMKSPDGISWTLVNAFLGNFSAVAYGPDMFIATRADNNAPQIMYTGIPSPTVSAPSLSHVFGQSVVTPVVPSAWTPNGVKVSGNLLSSPNFKNAFTCGAYEDSAGTIPITATTRPGFYYTKCTGPATTDTIAGFPSISNLTFIYGMGTYQVVKPAATITYPSVTKVYGDTIPFADAPAAATYASSNLTGLVSGDTLDASSVSWTFSSSANLGSTNVGSSYTYKIATGPLQYSNSGTSSAFASTYKLTESPATGGVITITKAPLTVTAPNTSLTVGNAVPTSFAPTYSGWKLGQTESTPPLSWRAPTCTAPSIPIDAAATRVATTAGTYSIVCSGGIAYNYSFTYVAGSVTVKPASPPVVTVTSTNESSTVGSPISSISYGISNLTADDWIPVGTDFKCVAVDGSNLIDSTTKPGSYQTTCTGPTSTGLGKTIDYVKGTYTVNKAPLTIVALDRNKVYGDSANAGVNLNATITGLVNSDTATVTFTYSGIGGTGTGDPLPPTSGAGTYTIFPSATLSGGRTLTDYYNVTLTPGTFTVSKAKLTVVADNHTQVTSYTNDPFPSGYRGFYYGWKNGDTTSVLISSPFCTATIPSNGSGGSVAGSYPISCTGGNAANYEIEFYNGVANVVPEPYRITAYNLESNYGEDLKTLGQGYYNILLNAGDSLPSITCGIYKTLSPSVLLTKFDKPGQYPIRCTGKYSSTKGVAIGYIDGTYTITKPTLTVTAIDRTRTYKDNFVAGNSSNANFSGFVGSDTATASVTFTYSSVQDTTTAVGQYKITPLVTFTSPDTRNLTDYYNVLYNDGIASVTPLKVKVTADNLTNVKYGSTPPNSYTYTVKRLDGSIIDSATVFSAAPTCTSGYTNTTPRGTVLDIVCDGGTLASSNYEVEFVKGTLEVEPVPLTISNTTLVTNKGTGSNPTVDFTAKANTGNWVAGCKVSWTLDPSAGTGSTYEAYPGNAIVGTSNDLVLNASVPYGVYNVTMSLSGNCSGTPVQSLLVVAPNTVATDSRVIGSGTYTEPRTTNQVDFSFEWRRSGSSYTTPFVWTINNKWRINANLGSQVTLFGLDGTTTSTLNTWGRNDCPTNNSDKCSTLIGQVMLQRWVPNWRLVSGGYWLDFSLVTITFRVNETASGADQVSMQMRQVPNGRAIPSRVPTSLYVALSSGSIQHLS